MAEINLPLDWDIIDAFNGFSFDMGGSVIKLAYMSEQDWKEPADRKPGSRGCLKLTRFSRRDIDKAFEFIAKKVRFNHKEDRKNLLIYASGFGATQYAKRFKEELNLNVVNLVEFDCFAHGLLHIVKNYPRSEILQPIVKEVFQTIKQEVKSMILATQVGFANSTKAHWKLEDFTFPQLEGKDMDKPLADEPGFFPCGYMMCGSGNGFSLLHEDGSCDFIDFYARGGKKFMSMASLMTGAKTYEEVMDLCVRGKASNVTETNKAIFEELKTYSTGSNDDSYIKIGERMTEIPEMPLFDFGHAESKDLCDFRNEDIARALLETIVADIACTTHNTARLEGLKHVFFCGGFCDHELVRHLFTVEWLRRNYAMRVFNRNNKDNIQAHFLKHGQSLGTIGALLNHKTNWSTVPGTEQ